MFYGSKMVSINFNSVKVTSLIIAITLLFFTKLQIDKLKLPSSMSSSMTTLENKKQHQHIFKQV